MLVSLLSREMVAQNVAKSRRPRTDCDVTHVGMIYTLFRLRLGETTSHEVLDFARERGFNAPPAKKSACFNLAESLYVVRCRGTRLSKKNPMGSAS
jgi:hypothetical protein